MNHGFVINCIQYCRLLHIKLTHGFITVIFITFSDAKVHVYFIVLALTDPFLMLQWIIHVQIIRSFIKPYLVCVYVPVS